MLAQVELERGDQVVIASINNLSLGGAFLLHPDDDVVVGDRVRVHMAAGAVESVQDARVVRVSRGEHSGFAVVWVDPTARTYAIVERLMRAS